MFIFSLNSRSYLIIINNFLKVKITRNKRITNSIYLLYKSNYLSVDLCMTTLGFRAHNCDKKTSQPYPVRCVCPPVSLPSKLRKFNLTLSIHLQLGLHSGLFSFGTHVLIGTLKAVQSSLILTKLPKPTRLQNFNYGRSVVTVMYFYDMSYMPSIISYWPVHFFLPSLLEYYQYILNFKIMFLI